MINRGSNMNWLIYICGGIIFIGTVAKVVPFSFKGTFKSGTKLIVDISFLYSIPAWVWICWKFIK